MKLHIIECILNVLPTDRQDRYWPLTMWSLIFQPKQARAVASQCGSNATHAQTQPHVVLPCAIDVRISVAIKTIRR